MHNQERLYIISDMPEYSHQIGHLISMMNYVRHTTMETVRGLSTEELDFKFDRNSKSIGALLLHFAAVEYLYQVGTFEGRNLNDEELLKWSPALKLGAEGREYIQGHNLDFYIAALNEVRTQSYRLFKDKTDEWLYEERD